VCVCVCVCVCVHVHDAGGSGPCAGTLQPCVCLEQNGCRSRHITIILSPARVHSLASHAVACPCWWGPCAPLAAPCAAHAQTRSFCAPRSAIRSSTGCSGSVPSTHPSQGPPRHMPWTPQVRVTCDVFEGRGMGTFVALGAFPQAFASGMCTCALCVWACACRLSRVRQEVCNNSPAKCISPRNGWR